VVRLPQIPTSALARLVSGAPLIFVRACVRACARARAHASACMFVLYSVVTLLRMCVREGVWREQVHGPPSFDRDEGVVVAGVPLGAVRVPIDAVRARAVLVQQSPLARLHPHGSNLPAPQPVASPPCAFNWVGETVRKSEKA
jgi:hypothetical protein